MKKEIARQRLLKDRNTVCLIGVFTFVTALLTVSVYSVQSSSFSLSSSRSVSSKTGVLSAKAGTINSLPDVNSSVARRSSEGFRSLLPVPQPSPETIATYAADCETPKSAFTLGETVCAITDNVDLNFPEPGRWVDWILTGEVYVTVSGSRTTTRITANPQTFTYMPTAIGTYKVEITEDDGNGGDNPQTPAVFTVSAVQEPPPPFATYASDCSTPKSDFNLGQTICIKVSGLSNEEFPQRRVQVTQPNGFVLARFPLTDNSQQFSYTLPTATTDQIGNDSIDYRGTWTVALADLESDLQIALPVVVHKSNLLADRVADLQVSKFFIDQGDPPTAGSNVMFQIQIINQGPDPATTVQLNDVVLSNTTFISFVRNAQMQASNLMPNTGLGTYLADNMMFDTNLMKFVRDPGFMSFLEDTPATFNCNTPSVGSPGTTTCTANADIAPGETAVFTAVYKVNSSVPDGTVITDDNSVTVGAATGDQFTNSNSESASITTTNPNPPACLITCPDNITVGTNATDGQGNPGAIVTFGPEASGECGNGITSQPASGSFFAVGSTPVTSTTGSGANCGFTVTVVNTPQPTITCAADQTATASSGQTEVNVTVNQPSYTGSFTQNQEPAALTYTRSDRRPLADPYPIGTTIITWLVTDQYGTQRSCDQSIIVTSSDSPTISCPSNKTFNATNGCTYTATAQEIGSPTTSGAASSSGEPCPLSNPCAVRSDHLPLTDPFPAGNTAITWTATNDVGSASCTQIITVVGNDTEAPTLHTPPSITTSTDQCSILLDEEQFVATAEDNCSSSVNISRTGMPQIACPAPGNPNRTCDSFYFPTGTTVITYTATDSAGNSTSGTQTVRVNENPNITPTIDAPVNLTVNTGPTSTFCGTFVGDATLGTATASDNCPGFVVTRSGVPAGNNFPVGTTTITYRATDRVGNFAEDTQTVTVIDNTPPAISCPANITHNTDPGLCSALINPGTATATDNCDSNPTIQGTRSDNQPLNAPYPKGTTTITWTATDHATPTNNQSSCQQTITVEDHEVPVITTNGVTPTLWPANHNYHTFNVTNFVTAVSDNCDALTVSNVVIEKVTSDETENGGGDGNTFNDIIIAADCKSVQVRAERRNSADGRVYTITFKVTDSSGNVGRKTATIEVPKNLGVPVVNSGPHYTVNGTCP